MTNLEYIKSKIIKNGELDVEGFTDMIMENTCGRCCCETPEADCVDDYVTCRACFKKWLDKDMPE